MTETSDSEEGLGTPNSKKSQQRSVIDLNDEKIGGTDYGDFDNLKEIIHEYFNPLSQNKKILF